MKAAHALLLLLPMIASTPVIGAAPVLPKSVSVNLPDGLDPFPGPGAEAINGNCLGCHSSDMVLNQPPLTKDAWHAEVAKMIQTYKAPVAEKDVDAIVDYLVRTKGKP
ncbi:MAG TPA: cytochrome c [Rhizomicrobium sp.]|nr:cytochrome c [Rhizomicrobium sp.]